MAFKMKGSSLYGKINLNRGGQASRPDGRAKSSAFQASVPTKEESKKKALSELNKIHNEQDDAEDRGDVLTENIAHTAGRKKLAEAKKLYGKKKGAPMKNDIRKTKRYKKAVKTEREMYAADNRKKRSKTFTGRITNKLEDVIKKGVKKVKSKVGAPMKEKAPVAIKAKKKVDPRTDPRYAYKLDKAKKKAARKKSPMEKAGGFDEVVEGFKTIGRTLKPSVKNVKKAGSDIKEGFRQLFTGDRTDSRTKTKKK